MTAAAQLEKARALLAAQRLPEAKALYQELCRHTPGDADIWYEFGNLLLGLGESAAAAECYQNAVGLRPTFAEAFNNLGVSQNNQGRYDAAVASYRRALALKPEYPMAHNNLGNTLASIGRLDEAAEAFERTLALQPDYAVAYYNLANLRVTQKRLTEAEAGYRTALARRADYPAAANNLGNLLINLERPNEAVELLSDLLKRHPQYPSARNNLGRALMRLERRDEAIKEFQAAVRLQPDFAEAQFNLGHAYETQKKPTQAAAGYKAAVRARPDYAEAYERLGIVLHGQGLIEEALPHYRAALQHDPGRAEAHANLGIVLHIQGEIDAAVLCYRQALALKPDYAEVYTKLASALHAQGKLDDSIAACREAIRLNPDRPDWHGNLLFALNYHPSFSPQRVFEEHRAWGERHARGPETIAPHANTRDPDKRLKVGYVSPDFRAHSVAYFIEPVLQHHDPARVESYCYAEVAHGDVVTEQLKKLANHWHNISGQSDAEVAARIRADGIDILVDLAGHTANNRLTLFGHRPAPVQATYLGYPNTSGVPAMDYRITDRHVDPPEHAAIYTEELQRLPGAFFCYAPPKVAPAVGPLPAASAGHITFGSFNNLAKINPEVLGAWRAILDALPDARLTVQALSLNDEPHRADLAALFERHGIARERLTILGHTPFDQYLALHNTIDIALDTFPHNGHTVTCHALWMGVPTVVLAGGNCASRMGVSIMANLGLDELIAPDLESYAVTAVRLARDRERLARLRAGLRERVKTSALCDGAAFTRDIEAAYREMWGRWCKTHFEVP